MSPVVTWEPEYEWVPLVLSPCRPFCWGTLQSEHCSLCSVLTFTNVSQTPQELWLVCLIPSNTHWFLVIALVRVQTTSCRLVQYTISHNSLHFHKLVMVKWSFYPPGKSTCPLFKGTISKRKSFSNHRFSGDMLIFFWGGIWVTFVFLIRHYAYHVWSLAMNLRQSPGHLPVAVVERWLWHGVQTPMRKRIVPGHKQQIKSMENGRCCIRCYTTINFSFWWKDKHGSSFSCRNWEVMICFCCPFLGKSGNVSCKLLWSDPATSYSCL